MERTAESVQNEIDGWRETYADALAKLDAAKQEVRAIGERIAALEKDRLKLLRAELRRAAK